MMPSVFEILASAAGGVIGISLAAAPCGQSRQNLNDGFVLDSHITKLFKF